jgi:hypothetical protein
MGGVDQFSTENGSYLALPRNCREVGYPAAIGGESGAPSHGPTGGVADSLDAAKAAFRAAGERPLSEPGADEICSTLAFLLMNSRRPAVTAVV